MDREEIKAISLQGIVHNATKIGVQDGQCEDLVNLRFKDGSWRTSGDGKHVFSMNYQSNVPNTSGVSYTQLFIHTNIYRHLLGVRNNKLYWFGNINADGEFESLSTPKELAPANNDLYICQTGHLLTVIDGDSFTYLLFKSSNNDYKALNVDLNGSQDSRTLYPFGQIHFNYADAGKAGTITEDKTGQDGWRKWGIYGDWGNAGQDIYAGSGKLEEMSGGGVETLHNTMVKMYGEILEKNYFTDPFLVCAAIKLYDGKYMYASAPAMIFPRQCAYNTATPRYVHKEPTNTTNSGYDELTSDAGFSHSGALLIPGKEVDASKIECYKVGDNSYGTPVTLKGTAYGAVQKQTFVDLTNENGYTGSKDYQREHARQGGEDTTGSFRNGICAHTYCIKGGTGGVVGHQYSLDGQYAWQFQIRGCNLCVSIDSSLVKVMNDNKDLFKSLCIFITPQSSVYKMDVKDKGSCRVTLDVARSEVKNHLNVTAILRSSVANMSYIPNRREDKEIRYDLLHSPFYLLREYTQDELSNLLKNPVVDLQDPQFEGVLKNITQQDTLKVEAVNRYSYIPKVQYTYNGRLHIANYTQSQFHGYPIDVYHLNNHSLEYDAALDNFRWFKGSLPYLKSFYDDTLSEKRTDHFLSRYAGSQLVTAVKKAGDVSAYVEVECDTDDGTQRVCRYIPFTPKKTINGYADFIETLDPLLTFPDSRAKKMTISILENTDGTTMTLYKKEFKLEAHPYLNIAYYLDDSLKPILLDKAATKSVTEYQTGAKPSFNQTPQETNTTESYPNGLKVSATSNPMYFPIENTYQVGAAEIVAMMSNAVAVGVGQTGSAPLYVFCKDGVYAMFVDETGEMTYTNSRIIARDVCNNARSVTPIDTGVVFTTDRGLMEIAGEQVTEIGQPMEGDWVKYTTRNHIDFSKIAKNAYYMKRIAALPDETTLAEDSMTQVDFLEYLKGSIINYNHNERELMVSNPAYRYTYILNREGNWSRRDMRAEQYVNNYPTSYRVEKGELYQVDKDSDADNGFFVMSHVVKLDSIGFKELHRLVARGYWETVSKKEYKTVDVGEEERATFLKSAEYGREGETETLSVPYFGASEEYSKERVFEHSIPEQVVYRQSFTTSAFETYLNTIRKENDIIADRTAVHICIAAKGALRIEGYKTSVNIGVRVIRNQTGEDILQNDDNNWIEFETYTDINEEYIDIYIAPQGDGDYIELSPDDTYTVEVWFSASIYAYLLRNTDFVSDGDLQMDSRTKFIEAVDTGDSVEKNISEDGGDTTLFHRKVLSSVTMPIKLFCQTEQNTLHLLQPRYAVPEADWNDRYQSIYRGLKNGNYYSKIVVPDGYNTRLILRLENYIPSDPTYKDDNTPNVPETRFHIPFDKTEQRLYNKGADINAGGTFPMYIALENDVDSVKKIIGDVNRGDEGAEYATTKLGDVYLRLYNEKSEVVWFAKSSSVRFDKNQYILNEDGSVSKGGYTNEFTQQIAFTFDEANYDVILPAGTYEFKIEFENFSLWVRDDVQFKLVTPLWYITLENQTGRIYYQGGIEKMYSDIQEGSLFSINTIIPAHTEQVIDPDKTYDTILGLYVFGSYDGRKWACLGHREKSGDFRDIGTLVERTDCRFFRFILAGQVSKDSRLDYFEVSSRQSKLSTKIR